jgi:dipeptidyl aminopeptidase/acylaminoacyl peptidase
VRYLLFGNDGHGIIKRENRATLAAAMSEWMIRAFDAAEGLGLDHAASSSG